MYRHFMICQRMAFACFLIVFSVNICMGDQTGDLSGISIAYNQGNPPIKFVHDGMPDGALIDIWKLWSQKTGVKVTFKDALFSRTLTMVKTGEADLHSGMFYTDERSRQFDFTVPILDISYMISYHESISGIDSLDDLSSFKIGVPEGYTHTFVKNNIKGAAINVYNNFPELFEAALKGEVKVFLSPVMNHQHYFQSRGIRSPFQYVSSRPAYTKTYYGAVKKGRIDLMELVNKGFEQISPAELTKITRNGFGAAPTLPAAGPATSSPAPVIRRRCP